MNIINHKKTNLLTCQSINITARPGIFYQLGFPLGSPTVKQITETLRRVHQREKGFNLENKSLMIFFQTSLLIKKSIRN